MPKFFHLSKNSSKKSYRRNKIARKININTKGLNIFLAALIVVLGVSYLIQTNALATKGYQIKELENKVSDLRQEKSDLELVALSLQSMGSIKNKVNSLEMVSAGEAGYLSGTPVVAVR